MIVSVRAGPVNFLRYPTGRLIAAFPTSTIHTPHTLADPTMKNPRARLATFSFATILLVLTLGCGGPDNRTAGDLVEHFKANGIDGQFQQTFAGLIGASEGGRYRGEGFSVEFYVFDDVSKAESLKKTGMSGTDCIRNGSFVLVPHKASDDILKAFADF